MSISVISSPTTSAATLLITGSTWAPESAVDVFTATLLSGTALPDTACPGPASPTHGVWLSPQNSITIEPLNQTTLDYALACCKNAGIYYFIDPQCSNQTPGSGLFCQPVGQSLSELDLCLKNGTAPASGIGNLYCHGGENECDQTAPIRSASIAIIETMSSADSSATVIGQAATSTPAPSASTAANAAPRILKTAPPVLVPHGDDATGLSKVVVAFGVAWAVALFAGAVAM